MIQDIIKNKPTRLFLLLGGFFIANALIAEFMGVKIFSLEKSFNFQPFDIVLFGNHFSFNMSAGVLLWPVVFVMTDIINEYYGTKGVKFLSYLTVGLISYSFFMFLLAIYASPADFWIKSNEANGVIDMNKAYKAIFGQGLWIIIGSLIAFLVGQILDVYIFHRIKKITGDKSIWLRATGSTLVSQLIDSFIVLFIAFYIGPRVSGGNNFQWPLSLILTVGVGNYIYKFLMAIVLTPVIYWVHSVIENYLGKDLAEEMKTAAMQRN